MFRVSCWHQCSCLLPFPFRGLRAGLDAIAVLFGLQYVATIPEAIEQGCGHFCVAEHAGPFAEAQVGSDDDAGALYAASLTCSYPQVPGGVTIRTPSTRSARREKPRHMTTVPGGASEARSR